MAACAPVGQSSESAGSAAPAAAAATITFVVDTINEGHVKVRDKWAADFSAANNVKVDHQPVPQDYTTKIQTLFAAGTPPDTAFIGSDIYRTYIKDKMLLDITG